MCSCMIFVSSDLIRVEHNVEIVHKSLASLAVPNKVRLLVL